MSKGRKRRLLAVMFTDMSDFSDMAAFDEDAALDLLREHNKIMKPLVKQNNAIIIKTIGDAIMGKFPAATDALNCALAMQRNLKQWNVDRLRPDQINVRIGVHVGDVVVVPNDILGVVTNLAKRLESIGKVGQVYCTEAAKLMVSHLPKYRFRHQGSWKPKGANTDINFYSVILKRLKHTYK